jgi:CheY-like chemotaxis protein
MRVQSAYGAGSAKDPLGMQDTTADVVSSPPKRVVLVVERDAHVRELEAHYLERAGYVAHFAEDGQIALAKAREVLPDIVVTEILVPKLDGLSLCRAIKSDASTRHIAVLIFSILSAKVRAREAGADAFLPKPLAEVRLIEMMQRLLQAGHEAKEAATP